MNNNVNSNKVLLIALPPCAIHFPLAGETAISSYLNACGFQSRIWYLNLALHQNKIFNPATAASSTCQQLVLLYLYNKYVANDEIKAKEVETEILDRGVCDRLDFQEYIGNIYSYIKSEIQKILNTNFLAVGFSSKYNQWIGAAVCIDIIKKVNPNQYVFMGAQNTRSESENIFYLVPHLDAASWGEGELPILALMQQLREHGYLKQPIERIVSLKENTYASLYQHGNSLHVPVKTGYISFSDHHFFQYEDYLLQKNNHGEVILPVEKSRCCNWNRCSFCILSQGYQYREKSASMIIEELYHYIKKYQLYRFQFFDNNFVGNDVAEFEKMLDGLIKIRESYPLFEIYFAEVITIGLNSRIIKKMSLAGVRNVQIGFEALSPLILKKFNKQQTLAQNLFFLKEALFRGIMPGGNNLIINYVDETATDIEDSIKNVPYLRFMLRHKDFSIQTPELMVANYSRYMKMIKEKNIEDKYSRNIIYKLIFLTPNTNLDRFSLFQFTSTTNALSSKWEYLYDLIQQYKSDEYEYAIKHNHDNSLYTYVETKHGNPINSYTFTQSELTVLKILNDSSFTLTELMSLTGYKNSEETFINEVLKNLIALKIVYYSNIDNDVVSIIRI